MTAHPLILAARRTAVAPRGGAFRALQADELAAPVIEALLLDSGVERASVDHVIFGNALYGGGNPARLAALRAGLPDCVPALTLDTQCCSGLDAILMASHLVRSGAARCVIAGGMESYSRAPIRMHRPATSKEEPVAYDRPSFAPFPERDPDLTVAAADLAAE
ncbi:MAG: beta-ketoacyl synthase N-terminal-like domain-containing protein, partial [Roseibium sp.]